MRIMLMMTEVIIASTELVIISMENMSTIVIAEPVEASESVLNGMSLMASLYLFITNYWRWDCQRC